MSQRACRMLLLKTIAISTIPGLGWVDPFLALPSWSRLPILGCFLLGFGFVARVLTPVPQVILSGFVVLSIVLLWLALLVIFGRGAQDDLIALAQVESVPDLAPTRTVLMVDIFFGAIVGIVLITVVGDPSIDLQTTAMKATIWVLLVELLMVVAAILGAFVFSFLLRQVQVFRKLASTIEFRLFQLVNVQTLARPFLRYLALLVLGSALLAVLVQFLGAQDRQFLLFEVLLPALAAYSVLGSLMLWPIVIMRRRIKAAKENELRIVRAAIGGDRTGLADSELGEELAKFTVPDLLYYEERLLRIWEWPIQQHLQRLVLYLLIPPLAWIMAALVERSLDFYLS